MKFSQLKKCPFCGSDEYYTTEFCFGTYTFTQSFTGKECDNSDMYEGLQTRINKKVYCRNCNEYLGNIIEDTLSKKAEKALKESR